MKAYLIVERNGKENHFEVLAKSKYEALKKVISEREHLRMYWKGNNPYLSNLMSSNFSREYVAIVK
jgi:hypothetical protein